MADFPLFGGTESHEYGLDLATSRGVVITAPVAPNTKGAYTEIISAANNTEDLFNVDLSLSQFGVDGLVFVDLAVGEAGFEVPIIENIFYYVRSSTGFDSVTRFAVPVSIPKGQRVSARMQSDTANSTTRIIMTAQSGGFRQGSSLCGVSTYGANLATTGGALVVQGVQSYGAFTELSASTNEEISGFLLAFLHKPFTSYSTGGIAFRVAVGEAGFEEIVSSGIYGVTNTNESGSGLLSPFNNVNIPKGSRVSVQSSATASNTDFNVDLIFYGVY